MKIFTNFLKISLIELEFQITEVIFIDFWVTILLKDRVRLRTQFTILDAVRSRSNDCFDPNLVGEGTICSAGFFIQSKLGSKHLPFID